MSDLTGRNIVITGASSGIGEALAIEAAQRGARVAIVARRADRLATVLERCQASSPKSTMVVADLSELDSIDALASTLIDSLDGRVDVLINNAGINRDDLLIQAEESDWDQVHEVTLNGAFLCTQAVLPIMVRQSEGHIVNISSYAGRCGVGGQSVYAAAKAGLLGLTLAIAREYGSQNIRVNAVLPGVLPTGMTQKLSQSQREVFRQQNVLGRFNDLGEVAAMVVFLCGTRNISGQVFQLDSRIAPWT